MIRDDPTTKAEAVVFTPKRAHELLALAGARLDLPVETAVLVRLGENAIFQLPDASLAVRIGRSPDKVPVVARELCVTRWLAGHGVPVVRSVDSSPAPQTVEGHPVSVWHWVEPGRPGPGAKDLAGVLRQVHDIDGAPSCDLPAPDLLGVSERRLSAIEGLPDADRLLFAERVAELRDRYASLDFALPAGVIHGDAHTGNLLGHAGAVVLGDFEATAVGPREWDLIPMAISRARFGRSDETYKSFTNRYGFDVTSWAGYSVLRAIRELYMTVWLAQNAGHGASEAAELELRTCTIRERDDTTEWHAF